MAARGEARVVVANRAQLSWDLINPDGWLAPDHRARLVVGFVETLDLTVLYDNIEAREGTAGRPAADPAVLFALWLLATMDGVGSARELDRLTRQDLAYRWVACGGAVNYRWLAACRSTTMGWRTSASRMGMCLTICSPKCWRRSWRRDCLTAMRSSSTG